MSSVVHGVALNAAELIDRLNEMVEEDPTIEVLGTTMIVAFKSDANPPEVCVWANVTPLSSVKMLTRAIALEGKQL